MSGQRPEAAAEAAAQRDHVGRPIMRMESA